MQDIKKKGIGLCIDEKVGVTAQGQGWTNSQCKGHIQKFTIS